MTIESKEPISAEIITNLKNSTKPFRGIPPKRISLLTLTHFSSLRKCPSDV